MQVSQNNKIDYFSIVVFDERWNIYLISESDEVTLEGAMSEAEIDFESKEIHFKKADLISVKHECWHLYKYYTYTNSANLDAEQEEEVSAEMFAHLNDKINKTAIEIYEKLRGLKNESDRPRHNNGDSK